MLKYVLKKQTLKRILKERYGTVAGASLALFESKQYLGEILRRGTVSERVMHKLLERLNVGVRDIAFEVRCNYPDVGGRCGRRNC